MNIIPTSLPGVLVIEPRAHGDERGFFLESYNREALRPHVDIEFVQDNHSRSGNNVLRGLHAQHPRPQAKLVRVTRGEVFDVAVDIRLGSPTFGRWHGQVLSEKNFLQMFIPAGFAHGFCVLGACAELMYKCSDTHQPQCELVLAWDDPDIAIAWPLQAPILSKRDQAGLTLAQLRERGKLPPYHT